MKAKFKKGDIVRYVKTVKHLWGQDEEAVYARDVAEYSKYIGNLGLVKVADPNSYHISAIEPLPYVAWYTDEELEYVTNILELL